MFGLGAPELIAMTVIALLIVELHELPELMRGLLRRLFARIEDPHATMERLMREMQEGVQCGREELKRASDEARLKAELEADMLQYMRELGYEVADSVTPAMMERRWELMRLSQRDDKEAIGQLIIALDSRDEWIRWRAAGAFADKAERNPRVILRAALPILQKRIQRRDETEWVRAACQTALAKIEEATRDWRDKPIPFTDFDTPTDTLPIPVDSSGAADVSRLPRPTSHDGYGADKDNQV